MAQDNVNASVQPARQALAWHEVWLQAVTQPSQATLLS
jgi:hypothetical protein